MNRFNVEDKLSSKHEVFRLVHLSDPHLISTSGVRVRELLNKRVYAYLSWHLHRHAEHREEVLDTLLKDLQSTKPDHIVLTGDLTHLGLPSEFHQARELLQALGPPSKVMVIPGNHDAYVATAWERTFCFWSDYMASDADQVFPEAVKDHHIVFPTLRVRGPMALIGVSTAYPTPLFLATGSIGKGQMKQAGRSGARYAFILGEREILDSVVTVRDLSTGQECSVSRTDAVELAARDAATPGSLDARTAEAEGEQ